MSENHAEYQTKAVQVREEPAQLAVADMRQQVNAIQSLMKDMMKVDEHYGTIPGCKKPSLFKAGAEKLSMMFRLAPSFAVTQTDLPNGHREAYVVCTLTHMGSGRLIGQGVGSCSTMESKYRYRGEGRTCPACGAVAIIKGKDEYGGGWLCFQKKGGCGTKFKDGDKSIEDQNGGKVENPDPADSYNTVLKMAKKRAHVDAILTATAASDIFTQDVEDTPQPIDVTDKPKAQHTEIASAAGADRSTTPGSGQIKSIPISEAQAKRLFAIAKGAGMPTDVLKRHLNEEYHVDHSKDISRSDYNEICDWASKWTPPPADDGRDDEAAERAAIQNEHKDDLSY